MTSENDKQAGMDDGHISQPRGVDGDTQSYSLPDDHLTREKWLHRKMTRSSAEKLLINSGDFLVRESCSSFNGGVPGHVQEQPNNNYVLSYKNSTDQFCHFKILQSCGQYFIGGKNFASLEHLVNYYMSEEFIITNEFLTNPIIPKIPIINSQKRRMIARYNYTRVPDTDELSLTKGEVLSVENDSGGGWFWLKSHLSHQSGWVHEVLVSPYVSCVEELKSKDYFALCDKEEIVKLLKNADPGCFAVREGTKLKPTDAVTLTLWVRTIDNIQRFKIEVKTETTNQLAASLATTETEEDSSTELNSSNGGASRDIDVYFMGGRKFSSVDQLITRYKTEEILDNLKLTHPPKLLLDLRGKENGGGEMSLDLEMNNGRIESQQQKGGGCLRNGVAALDAASGINNSSSVSSNQQQRKISQDASDLVGNYDSVLQKGFLDKFYVKSTSSSSSCSGAVKKWKRCYFVLNAREQRLYCFEDNSRRTPKVVIDMTTSQVYPIDISLSDRNFAFQLVTRLTTSSASSSSSSAASANHDHNSHSCANSSSSSSSRNNSTTAAAPSSIIYFAAISATERQEWMSCLMMCQGKFPFLSSVGQLLEQKSVEKLMERKSRECQNLYVEIKQVMDIVCCSSSFSSSSSQSPFLSSSNSSVGNSSSTPSSSLTTSYQNLFILVQLDDVPYAKTCTLDQIKSQCTIQKFSFKKLPAELKTVRLVLMSKHKKGKKQETELGCAVINLQQLAPNTLHCRKLPFLPPNSSSSFHLSASSAINNHPPSIPLSNPNATPSVGIVQCEIFLKHLTILPEEMYTKLKNCLLSADGPKLLYELGQCLPVDDRNFYACLLLKTYLHLKSEINFIVSLNSIEIENEQDQMSLFRSTSLSAAVMSHYLNIVMLPFVQQSIQPIIYDIASNTELMSIGSAAFNPEKWAALAKQYLQSLADNILGQVDQFPTNLRYILQQLKKEVDQKWPPSKPEPQSLLHQQSERPMNNGGVSNSANGATNTTTTNRLFKYRVIASFIFLRCISLALCTPQKYNLTIGSPPHISAVQEMLVLLAKLLQCWANFTQLKDQSGFDVHSLNSYLRQHQERMEFFLEGVSTSPQGADQSSGDDLIGCGSSGGDLAEKFASVLRLCSDNHSILRKHSFSLPSLKKLLLIVEEIAAKAGTSLID